MVEERMRSVAGIKKSTESMPQRLDIRYYQSGNRHLVVLAYSYTGIPAFISFFVFRYPCYLLLLGYLSS